MRKPPFIVEYEITTQCNFRCIHCYCEAGEKSKRELTFEEIKKVILDMKTLGVGALDLVGGEPLLHPNLLDVLAFAKEVGQRVMINTNGSLATPEMVRKIKRTNPDVLVGVSIEGPDPETNDYVRGKGNFQRAIEGIRNFVREGFEVTILNVMNKRNWMKIEETIKLAKSLGVSALYIDRFIPVGRGMVHSLELDMTPLEWSRALRHINEVIEKYSGEITFHVEESISGKPCPAGITHASILVDGTVVPCGHFRYSKEYYMGNVREKSFVEIWNEYTPIPSPQECTHCELFKACGGGCKAYYVVHGYPKDEAICTFHGKMAPVG